MYILGFQSAPEAGMIQRVIDALFNDIAKESQNDYSVKFSMLQIYQDEVYDLLSEEPPTITQGIHPVSLLDTFNA